MMLIGSCNPPYTQGYLNTNPLPEINTVFDRLFTAYIQPELKQDFESLLFLHSAESIFQVSFLLELYSLWNNLFDTKRNNTLERFYYSFLCSVLLRDCPFHSIKLYFLDKVKSFCEDECVNFATIPNFVNPFLDIHHIFSTDPETEFSILFHQIRDTINLLNELCHTLYECLIETYITIDQNDSITDSIPKLLHLLWYQLTGAKQFNWSMLERFKNTEPRKRNLSDYHLRSLLDNYIDFYTLRRFFDINIPKNISSQNTMSNFANHLFQDEYMQYLRRIKQI